MSNRYLVALVKTPDFFIKNQILIQFYKSKYKVDLYYIEILACLKVYSAKKLPDNVISMVN